jgi:hypothetical protein
MVVVKLDSYGQVEWSRKFHGNVSELTHSGYITQDKGYMIVGRTSSFSSTIVANAALIKLDRAGNIEWGYAFGSTFQDTFDAALPTADGGHIAVGEFYTPFAKSNMYVVKVNSLGSLVWSNAYGTPVGSEIARSIELTSDLGYVISGTDYSNAVIIKISSTGQLLWERSIKDSYITINSMRRTIDDGYVSVGGIYNFTQGHTDGFVYKVNYAGTQLWALSIIGAYDDVFTGLVPTDDGGCILLGSTKSVGTNTRAFALFVRINSVGTIIWSRAYQPPSGESVATTAQIKDEMLIAAGSTTNGAFIARMFMNGTIGYMDCWMCDVPLFTRKYTLPVTIGYNIAYGSATVIIDLRKMTYQNNTVAITQECEIPTPQNDSPSNAFQSIESSATSQEQFSSNGAARISSSEDHHVQFSSNGAAWISSSERQLEKLSSSVDHEQFSSSGAPQTDSSVEHQEQFSSSKAPQTSSSVEHQEQFSSNKAPQTSSSEKPPKRSDASLTARSDAHSSTPRNVATKYLIIGLSIAGAVILSLITAAIIVYAARKKSSRADSIELENQFVASPNAYPTVRIKGFVDIE